MEENYLYLDLEATDLNLTTAKIIQIGILFREKKYSILVNPSVSITNSYIHNITDSMVEGKQSFADIAPELLRMIKQADCLVGYNIRQYDMPLLYIEFLRCGIDLHKECKIQLLDVLEMVREVEQSKKLTDVYRRTFKEELKGSHDALNDISATKKLYEYYYQKYYQ